MATTARRRHSRCVSHVEHEAPDVKYSLAADTFAAEFLLALAGNYEIFRYPVSSASTVKRSFVEFMPDAVFVGDRADGIEALVNGAEHKYLLRTVRGHDFHVYVSDDEVWIDVSELEEGEGGSNIYAAVAGYALNTGREFIGDPAGMSDIALRRRTEAMLSSALKHGTTRHLRPHPRQEDGDAALGVPPLKWVMGDDLGNVRRLIEVSSESLFHYLPAFREARYDFSTRTFRTGEGQPLTDGMLVGGLESRDARSSGAGCASLKRVVLAHSLLRIEGGRRSRLLKQVLHESAQRLPVSLREVLY